MAPDWGVSERHDPPTPDRSSAIGASFRMLPAATFASLTTEVWNHVYCLAKYCKEMKCKYYCDEVYTQAEPSSQTYSGCCC
jgi:hypothetical protein